MVLFKRDLNPSRKLVWILIFLVLGIIVGYYTSLDYSWSLFVLLVLAFLSFTGYIFTRRTIKAFLILMVFVAGIAWIDFNEKSLIILEKWHKQTISISGQVAEIIPRDYQVVIDIASIDAESLDTPAKVVVKTAWGDGNTYRWGDKVEFTGRLEKPMPQTNPGGFSEQDYWRQKGVGYILDAAKEGRVVEKAAGIKYYTLLVRGRIYELINSNIPSEEGAILTGLLLGDKKAMDEDFYATAQKMGIAHVFAVSGLHVGVVLAFYLMVTRFLKISHNYLVLIGAILLLGSYCLLVGFTPSVVRASVMGLLGIMAVMWLKYKDFYTIIAVAALVIIFADPLGIFNIGFQLSFITALGLFYFTPLAQRLFNFLPSKWALILAVPVAAQLASIPLTLYHFNTLPLLAPLVNLLVVPIVSLLVPLLFVAIFLATMGLKLAQPFLYLAGGIAYTLSLFIEYFISIFSEGHLFLARPSLILIAVYYLSLIGLREKERFKAKTGKVSFKLRLLLISIPLVLLVVGTIPRTLPLEVVFLDVGQGDGAVLRTPYNQYVVVDGGPGSTTVSQYLRYKGVNKVSLVILSHPDSDHITGLYKVLKDFKVGTVLVPPDVEDSEELRQFKDSANRNGTRIVEGKNGVTLKLQPGIFFQVLAPEREALEGLDINNASLIINCSYKNQDFLFTGDVDQERLVDLLPLKRSIEVIKIPHHGSRGSYIDSFFQEVKPKVAVISAGRGNRYGHPHAEVVQGLEELGVQIYRTDKLGAIILSTNGEDLWVETMLPGGMMKGNL